MQPLRAARGVLALAVLVVSNATGFAAPARAAEGVRAIPPEPGAVILTAGRTLHAIVGDVDSDGQRELLRLTEDSSHATLLEVWRLTDGAWQSVGEPLQVLAGTEIGRDRNLVYADAEARLIAWDDGDGERVLLATRPHFEELEIGPACCLVLEDVRIDGGVIRLVGLGGTSNAVGAILALDLDGDGRDELLTTRSLPPLGDISFPIEARIYRYDGEQFSPPERTELPAGSGDSPFFLGDSDGLPGEEAGLISTLGAPGLYRIRLDPAGALLMEDSDLSGATTARSVALAGGPGVVVGEGEARVTVARWPPGGPAVPIVSRRSDGRLLGVAETAGGPLIAVHDASLSRLSLRGTDLEPVRGPAVTQSVQAAMLDARSVAPYVGALPGGGVAGESALIYAGRLIGAVPDGRDGPRGGVSPIAPLAGAVPLGLAGDGSWMAILHADLLLDQPARGGGPLSRFSAGPGSWVSVVPLAAVLRPEEQDSATFTPPIGGAVEGSRPGQLIASTAGFGVAIEAPPGAHVLTTGTDPSVPGQTGRQVVPASGRLNVTILPPLQSTPNPRFRPGLIVLTPAGHGYVAAWQVQVLNTPPDLSAVTETPFLSSDVTVRGSSDPGTRVLVDGRRLSVAGDGSFRAAVALPPWPSSIEVEAVDPVGNRSSITLSGVGLLDYRRLPWVPIVAILTVFAGMVLYVRVPRVIRPARRAEDDATLEELEPE